MTKTDFHVPEDRLSAQRRHIQTIKEHYRTLGLKPLALVDTYGCQQNEADSQKIRGMLKLMGFDFTSDEFQADLIVINTCAVREHAEQRVFGNLGALTHTKREKPSQIICLCGCMAQQESVADKVRRSFRHVDLLFGPHALWMFPELLLRILHEGGRVFSREESEGNLVEGLPILRDSALKPWVSIMYGCDNFCTYCIVPHVRGRERSREKEAVITEVKELIAAGAKDICLLGQNVNSYGGSGYGFSELLDELAGLEGDFLLRFMTSHPKDASRRLFETMAKHPKIAKQLHLPFQAGSDEILRRMNRGYSQGGYLQLIDYARSLMPDIVISSDVIVGFPGESEADFEQTLELVETVGFDALFTFIYSKRAGTPAASMADETPKKLKQQRFNRLLELQNRISLEKHAAYVGKTLRVLIDGESGDERYCLSGRTEGNRLVRVSGDTSLIGSFQNISIDGSSTWSLTGCPAP